MKKLLYALVSKYLRHRKYILLFPVPLMLCYLVLVSFISNEDTIQKESQVLEVVAHPIIQDSVVSKKALEQSQGSIVVEDTTVTNPVIPQKQIIEKTVVKKIIVVEEEPEKIETIQQFVNHTPRTKAVPKQYIKARISGKQTVSAKDTEVRIQLLEPLQLEAIRIPQGTYLDGVALFEEDRVFISIAMIDYNGDNYPVDLTVKNERGNLGIPMLGKSKLKLRNTIVIIETK